MASLTLVAEYVGYALILLTALSAADAVIRRGDRHRVNILAFVTALPLSGFLRHPRFRFSGRLAWPFSWRCRISCCG